MALIVAASGLAAPAPARAQLPVISAASVAAGMVVVGEPKVVSGRTPVSLGPRVVIISRRGDGDPPPRSALADLHQSIGEGLGRSGARVVDAESLGVRPGSCGEGSCLETLRAADELDYVLWATLTASDRNYTLRLEIERLSDASMTNVYEERCALCGLAEACERVEEGAAGILAPLQIAPPRPPELRIETTPSEARILLDGEFTGRSPIDRVLTPGPHRIEVSASGYREMVQEIDAKGSEQLIVHLGLAPVPLPPPPPPPPRIKGWVPLGLGIPALAGGTLLAALDGRAPLGCGTGTGGCDADIETTWAAAGTLVAGAALTTAGAIFIHRWRMYKKARAEAKIPLDKPTQTPAKRTIETTTTEPTKD